MSGLSTAFHRTDTKDYEVYGLADRQTDRHWEKSCVKRKNKCVLTMHSVLDGTNVEKYSQTSVHECLGSWTIRFTNKFSEHKASQMTYCVSSYKHASCQHRGAISWEYHCRQYVVGPKSNEKFFFGGVRAVSYVCSRLVRVRDCPPH